VASIAIPRGRARPEANVLPVCDAFPSGPIVASPKTTFASFDPSCAVIVASPEPVVLESTPESAPFDEGHAIPSSTQTFESQQIQPALHGQG
jgi:hypothetical protein